MKYCRWLNSEEEEESLPAWGVRVEISRRAVSSAFSASLPAWGVRVEINMEAEKGRASDVTPRMGSAG